MADARETVDPIHHTKAKEHSKCLVDLFVWLGTGATHSCREKAHFFGWGSNGFLYVSCKQSQSVSSIKEIWQHKWGKSPSLPPPPPPTTTTTPAAIAAATTTGELNSEEW